MNINAFQLVTEVFELGPVTPRVVRFPSLPLSVPGVQVIELAQGQLFSHLGVPIFDVVRFKPGVVPGTTQEYLGMDLLDMPIIEVQRSKNIVETQVQGRDGAIRELISLNDYQVTIRGVLIQPRSENPPYEKIQLMADMEKVPAAIEVDSRFLNMLGIYNLVIQEVSFPSKPGYMNVQPYVLTCVQDTPAELKIAPI